MPEAPITELIAHVPQVGRLDWIGRRPERAAPMERLEAAALLTDRGLEGDRAAKRSGGKRQVSLLQAEHLEVLARLLRKTSVDPALLRRNLIVSGVPLRALARARFRVGPCLLEGAGECHPCSKMEAALGDGGYAAMRGHGGILARVLEGGPIRIGDRVHIEGFEGAQGS
ncbi:MAG: MOSC domain-containing protein [Myxococcota bacterium]|nr:MOSC domain-containing protein [Myxococcota bacterium]